MTRIRTFVIAYVFALALFLFAQHHPEAAPSSSFRTVVDLTRSVEVVPGQDVSTRLEAPAHFAKSLWTVDQIPAERLIAPLVVLDVSRDAQQNPDYQISVADIARWEQANGHISLGSVVFARTKSSWNTYTMSRSRPPLFSLEAAKFLVEGRQALGLGADGYLDRSQSSGTDTYVLSHSVYVLKNVTNLERVPAHGAVAMIAPAKMHGRAEAPARVFALFQ